MIYKIKRLFFIHYLLKSLISSLFKKHMTIDYSKHQNAAVHGITT